MSHTILFLAANPVGTAPRELDREVRAIQTELERSGFRDQFSFETRWAVEPLDLLRELRKLKPAVVHYSGHGAQDGLFLQDAGGGSRLVPTEALAQTFSAAGSSVKVVILSACYSEAQANALIEHVDCVVGMGSSIDADAARSFAIGFYGGLGERESIAAAFQQGMAAISLMGLRDSGRPQLKVRRGVDADRLVLAESSGGRHSPSYMLSTSRVDVPALHRKIIAQFSRDEIGQLCMELEEKLHADGIEEPISIDIVGGQSTSEIARNLISHLQRRGLLPYLVEVIDAGGFILAAARAGTQANQASTGAAAPRPSRLSAGKTTPPTVDIGILTIRDDEFLAVLGAFPNQAGTCKGRSREYTLRHADAGNGARYTVATLRLVEQGHGEAQDAARDLIDDLAPRLILVVGIAGGLPSDDVTLGDVVVSTRIHDFTIEARQAGQEPAYAVTGGPVDKALAAVVANLAAREEELGNWTADLPVRPQLSWTRRGELYGPAQWQSELRAKLEHHHGKGSTSRAPRYAAGPIASSDRLVKDPDLLIPWLQAARNLLAIEMESGGVFRAARERCPMLAIRGISGIVGLRRADDWTKYACASAAAFTRAFLRTRPIEVSSSEDVDTMSAATPFERLWHRLRTAAPPAPVTTIAVQPWREIQPNVEEVVRDRTVTRRVVFTSEGGVGKSRLLGALYGEQTGTRVWVDTVAPLQDLEEALAVGARAGHRTGEALTIFVDAIEQVDDPAALLGTIERALVACDRAVVYAATRLATWTDIRDRLSGWRGVRLARWSAERIRVLAQAGRTEPLSADLIDLLRTPLLLDLFLRTFTSGNAVPAGLATRHGVLRAYFERRVYVGESATARRAVLDAGVATVLSNGATWRDVTPAADQLTSEGVVMAVFGELRFRHALLRDFSAALQLVPRMAEEIAAALRDVINPVVRNELLRGVIEAQLDPDSMLGGPSIEELVRECTSHGLPPGIALGTTDAPTPALLAAIAPIEGGAVLRQAMAQARLIDNRVWLRIPSALGGECPGWFGEAQLQAMASLAELAFATGDAVGAALASTLRTWTSGQRASGDGAWSIATIGALLVRTIPDDATARWYESLELGDTGFKGRFLEQLRDLGANSGVDDAALSDALDKVVFGAGSHVLDGSHSLWEVTNLCLFDHDGNSGLLTTRPYVALSLLFRLSVALELKEDRRRRSILTDPALAKLFANLPPPPADLLEAEARLRIEPTLTDTEAIGDLVDDAPSTDRHAFGYVDELIEDVAQRAGEEGKFAETLATVAIASRSVRARIIALSLRGSTRIDDIGIEILRDPRIYHFQYASGALWDAIHARWSALTPETRRDVQKNILARAQSPLLPFTQVGRLASAIPPEDLEPALQPYVEFLEASGRSTAPTRPARVEALSGDMGDEDSEVQPADSGWRRFEALADRENDQVASREAVAMLRAGAADLTADTSDSIWFAVSRVVGRDEKHGERALDSKTAEVLFEAALGATESRRQDAESWGTLLDIADACPSYLPENEALAMRTRIIAEVIAGAGERAEHEDHAWRALIFVRPIAWFSDGTGGRAVFESWYRGSLNGKGLQASLRMLQFVPGNTRLDLVRHVLETDARLNMDEEGHAFLNEVGRLFGAWSIWWTEPWARDLVRDWCDAAVRPGALATPEAWRWFISGFGWSLQNEVRHVRRDPRAEPGLGRFVALLEQSWTGWQKVIDDGAEGNVSVGWSILAPLAKRFTTHVDPPASGWSVSLRRLVPRVVAEGGRNDIFAFQQVDWAAIDPETLALVADATIARADQEISSRPPTDWMIDGLIAILGAIGQRGSVPLTQARRVLDCLQRLGRSASKATSAAMTVEREVRAREIARER